ncbi:MAG: phosphoglucosamine mutase, partial [Planctomycetes bacterium]|nr:phosphoglucosamine mutase [Planctomycetota bacterium]
PAAALLVRRRNLQLGIVVSASHNPMQDNGIKIFGSDGRKLSDDTELEIEHLIDRAGSRDVDFTGAEVGRLYPFVEGENIYLEAMVGDFFKDLDLSGCRVVIDCANGSGSRISPRILAALGADVIAVHHEPDGCNINDQAGVFYAANMAPVVREHRADLGLALDGDGDRVILVDDQGAVCDGDHMLAILGSRLSAPKKKEIVATVMSNLGLRVLLDAAGIKLHQTAVGDRYVAEKMEQSGASVGGEQSGHIIFRDEHGWFGDGLYTALAVMRVMLGEGKSLSELASSMEVFPQILENVVVREKPPISEIPPLQEAIAKHQVELGSEGRILVRYSGTEKLARVMVEGRDADRIAEIARDLAGILRSELG